MGEADRERLKTFVELTGRLLEGIDLDDALQLVCDAALELLPAEHASVRVLDESGERLLTGARSGVGADAKPLSFKVGEGVLGWIVEQGVPVRIDDCEADARFKRDAGQGFVVRSLINVPLLSAGKVLGVLGVTASRAGAFDGGDELTARLLANCATPAIERARLQRLAITDHHTLAYNQRYFLPRLREEISRARRYGQPLSLLMIDLDRFKAVNDEEGHAAGDALLASFAERIRSLVRLSDVLIRRGGDEFVIIAPSTPIPAVLTMAERIRKSLDEEPLSAGSGRLRRQTVSVGVVQWRDGESAEDLEARADAVMYRAKGEGRNRVIVE